MTVIEHDFGGGERRIIPHFTRLVALDALHEHNVRENPLPYLERASEHIYQLEALIFEAARAARPAAPSPERVYVDSAEYEALARCRAMLEIACAKLASTGE